MWSSVKQLCNTWGQEVIRRTAGHLEPTNNVLIFQVSLCIDGYFGTLTTASVCLVSSQYSTVL